MGDLVSFKTKEKETMIETNNVEYLRLATGGKEPPADGNWLSLLDTGTIFLVQSKRDPTAFALGEFILMAKTSKSVIVMSPDQPGKRLCFNPVRFCNQYLLWEVLGSLETSDITPDVEEPEVKKE